jgi:anti-anti-sigma regulatory factor
VIDFIEGMDGKEGVLRLGGDITVQQAEELKETLIRGLGSVDKVYVDSSKSSDIDLTCLQLLCAAHRSATRMGKSFQLAEPVPGRFMRLAESAGFARHTGCRLDITKTCIWVGLFRTALS